MPRSVLVREWVKEQLAGRILDPDPDHDCKIEAASADASFRRYFRVTLSDGSTRIVMDAPPEQEDCRPFLKVAALFQAAGVHVPEVYAADLTQGFLLLSDLGRATYLDLLDASTAPKLYADASSALVALQLASRPGVLPNYDRTLLSRELDLFPDWYVARHLGVTLDAVQQATLRAVFDKILANNLAQAQVFVHRDYHSRNLMASPESFPNNPGILDFQDAVYGPLTYDVVSLYRDAYIHWEEDQELDFVIRYWEKARKAGLPVQADFYDYYRDYEWMGVQRQLKVLGIFARLFHRDGKDGYLKDMPTVIAYLRQSCERYLELRPLARLFDQLENRQAAVGYTF
jgi:hypothetical protein